MKAVYYLSTFLLLVLVVSGRSVFDREDQIDSRTVNVEPTTDETTAEEEGSDKEEGPKEVTEDKDEQPKAGEKDRAFKTEELENSQVHKGSDVTDDLDNAPDLFLINEKVASKQKNGVIQVEGMPGSHVDFGDIIFRECEQEELFGTSGNMPNPKCKDIMRKAKKRITKSKKVHQRDIITRANSKWPLTIPYSIANITAEAGPNYDRFLRAFEFARWEYGNKTCLRFREKNAQDLSWFDFKRGLGCNSGVGKWGNGAHVINIEEDGCDYPMTVTHEMMHALGFWHEQSRLDRETYVHIEFANVDVVQGQNMSYNFEMAQNSDAKDYDYDYISIMHYPRTAFGIKDVPDRFGRMGARQTIFPLNPNVGTLGACPNCGLTEIDALQMNERYCNTPKDCLNNAEVETLTKRWMLIFNQRNDDVMSLKLVTHLLKIYPHYRFLVVKSRELPGNKDIHSMFQCVTVREFGKDVTVCYNSVQGRPNKFPKKKVHGQVLKALDQKACNVNSYLELVQNAVKGRKVVGYKYVPFGFSTIVKWNDDANAIWVNFSCEDGGQGSVGLLFA